MNPKIGSFFKITRLKLLNLFRKNWQIKLVSLLLAILLWFVICEYVDPQTDVAVSNLAITYQYDGSDPQQAGIGMLDKVTETVDIRVSGSRDAIALMDPQKITASLDLANITTEGVKKVPVKIDLGNQGLKLEAQSINTMKIEFERISKASITVQVEFEGAVTKGLISKSSLSNEVIEVSGPVSVVSSIHYAKVTVGKGETLSKTKTYNGCEYLFVDKDGNEVDKTFLSLPKDVDTIDVTIAVLQEKVVPLVVNVANGGPDGNYFCSIKVHPETIKIAGDPEVLKNISSIAVKPVDSARLDLSGRKEAFEEVLPIVLQDGLTNVENVESAKVRVSFENVLTRTFNVKNLEMRGDNVHGIKIAQTAIVLKVRGFADDVNKLKANDIKVFVDSETVGKVNGATYLPISVEFPENMRVGIVGKYEIKIQA